MIRKSLAIIALVLGAATLAACQRDAAPPASATPDASMPAAPTSSSTSATPNSPAPAATVALPASAEPAAFDPQAFAGTYAAPGARLDVTAQGGYRLSVHAESANADLVSTGRWTADPDARHVRLQPDDRSEPGQRYEIVSKDELRAQDGSRILRRGADM